MKVALLEASHWHVPLYLDALEAPGIQVVAVSDAEQVKGQAIAARFRSTLYSSAYELLEREDVDFAFVFGRHSEMPTLAEAVIERKIPFALEKPCGVNMSQVTAAAQTDRGSQSLLRRTVDLPDERVARRTGRCGGLHTVGL
ncbi:Gfo/Idh/MocA family oxidoreductase [Paraburkholderia sp. 32]|uniref:Gfo/Idh/MocA family oxidoreductase n=1 Tax=Paraburkholderia sp. 32 TaxID=2991057 RepID=UPI003D19BEEA